MDAGSVFRGRRRFRGRERFRGQGVVRRKEVAAQGRGKLPCDTDVTEAIRAVAGDFDIEDRVAVGQWRAGINGKTHAHEQRFNPSGIDRSVEILGKPVEADFHSGVEVNKLADDGKWGRGKAWGMRLGA